MSLIKPLGLAVAALAMITGQTMANSILNGSFESPSTGPSLIIGYSAPSSPAGFSWTVGSGAIDPGTGSVEVVAQGYAGVFTGPAYAGQQWLDLDGISPGSISQNFATTVGIQYTLQFAYANNPGNANASAIVSVENQSDSANLITPFTITHSTSTFSNYEWTLSSSITFTATGTESTLSFVSQDTPGTQNSGIFLDAVSVVSPVPEPSSIILAGIAGTIGLGYSVHRRKRAAV